GQTTQKIWVNETIPADCTITADNASDIPYFNRSYQVGNIMVYEFVNVPPGNYSFWINMTYSGPNDGRVIVNNASINWSYQTTYATNASAKVYVIPEFSSAYIPTLSTIIIAIAAILLRRRRKS
ncbi:MAG: hypothetical protein DRN20_05550, partial [Thermoplasmata archaeon]